MFKYGGDFARGGAEVASKLQGALQVNKIASEEGFKLLHANIQGVTSEEIVLSARNTLDQIGKTGEIGANLKFLDTRVMNQVYCALYVEDVANIDKIIANNFKPERHHILSNKCYIKGENSQFYQLFLDEMGITFEDPINTWVMPHNGSHPKKYHKWLREEIIGIRRDAGSNIELKRKLFIERIKDPIIANPRMLDSEWWR